MGWEINIGRVEWNIGQMAFAETISYNSTLITLS